VVIGKHRNGFVTNQERVVVFVVMKLTILHSDSTVPVMKQVLGNQLKKNSKISMRVIVDSFHFLNTGIGWKR